VIALQAFRQNQAVPGEVVTVIGAGLVECSHSVGQSCRLSRDLLLTLILNVANIPGNLAPTWHFAPQIAMSYYG